MSERKKALVFFGALAILFILTGVIQSWSVSIEILKIGLLSAIMALGVNIQWGYAGLFNTGVLGFLALGGLGVVLTSVQPTPGGWAAGGWGAVFGLFVGALTIGLATFLWNRMKKGTARTLAMIVVLVVGFFLYRGIFDPAVTAIEANDAAKFGNIGGLGLPSLLGWITGGLFAAAAAFLIGKIALGLRSDYLAIATLGIAEIIIAVLKNEDWLARGVKNIVGIPRPWPVPQEVDLQNDPGFVGMAQSWGVGAVDASTIVVKLAYCVMFAVVLGLLIWLCERALNSPWGRMMRAIRDNEVAAEAMGKDVKRRHLQVFVLGSAVLGLAGAIMVSLNGQLAPSEYIPLRYTFLIWVMVIFGGSGNNWGSVLGALVIWWLWVMVEPMGLWALQVLTAAMPDGGLKKHLLDSAAHMRFLTMGVILLVVLRFSPRGLLPGK
ncbi:MAG: branched-chain amino acid ABC transporter permease [Paracoccaceae bacterium]